MPRDDTDRARSPAGRVLAATATVVCLGSVFASVAAGSTVTIGPSDVSGEQGSAGCSPNVACSQTFAQLTQPTAGVLLRAPADGVITAWHVHGAACCGPVDENSLALRVLRPELDGRFTAVGTSAPVEANDADGSPAHAVSIPIRAGDQIGVDTIGASGGGGAVVEITLPSGANFGSWPSGLPDGSTLAPSTFPAGRLMLNAVESLRPAVTSVSPSSGSTAGGGTVTISGSNLDDATGVSFGGTPAASVTAVSPTQVTATAPPQSQGTVDVQVTGPGGVSPATGADQYTYIPPGTAGGSSNTTSGGVSLAAVGTETLSPRVFPAAPSGPSASGAKRRYGTKVSYRLNEAAGVHFTVVRPQPGRTTPGGRCTKPTKANRSARKCIRLLTVRGGFTRAGGAGSNSFHFTGRLAGRKLKPGRYQLVATPNAGGKTGRAANASFQIIN